jgi:hypothetical protein
MKQTQHHFVVWVGIVAFVLVTVVALGGLANMPRLNLAATSVTTVAHIGGEVEGSTCKFTSCNPERQQVAISEDVLATRSPFPWPHCNPRFCDPAPTLPFCDARFCDPKPTWPPCGTHICEPAPWLSPIWM